MTDTTAPLVFGDIVRVRQNRETTEAGIAGLYGTVYGFTTPSASGVAIVGSLADDFAMNVHIDSLNQAFWLDPSAIELLERPETMEFSVGEKTIRVTQQDGVYKEEIVTQRPWWKFW